MQPRRQFQLQPIHVLVGIGALILVIIGFSSCGGDDSPAVPIVVPTDTTSSTTSTLSKEEFIAQADPICETANAKIAEYAANGEGVTAATQIADLRQGVLDDLTALGPPDEDRTTLDDLLTALEAQVEAGSAIGLAVDRGESDFASFEADLDAARADGVTAGEAYGFKVCGQEASSSADATATDTSGATDTGGTSVTPVAPSAPTTDGTTDGTGAAPTDGGGATPDPGGGGVGIP